MGTAEQDRKVWVWFMFLRTGFLFVALAVLELTLYTRLALNSEICLPACLCLLSAGIRGTTHYPSVSRPLSIRSPEPKKNVALLPNKEEILLSDCPRAVTLVLLLAQKRSKTGDL